MKICSWNVNSVRQRAHCDHDSLTPWLQEHRPDVACLQELQCTAGQFPHRTVAQAGYRALISTQKGKNGVALLTRLDAPEPRCVSEPWPPGPSGPAAAEARFVAGNVQGVVVACVYVPYGRGPHDPQWVHKLRFFEDLRVWARGVMRTGVCLAIAGDFNVAPGAEDAPSPDAFLAAGRPPKEELWSAWCDPRMRQAFRGLLDIGLQDVGAMMPVSGRPFTMWDTRNFEPHTKFGVRVDLILASAPLALRLTDTQVHSAMRYGIKPSDHVPVAATFKTLDRMYGALSGSRLYGLDTPESDADVRGLFLPSRDDLLLGRVHKAEHVQRHKAKGEKNNADDVDITFISPTQFVEDLMTGQPCAWELLFAPPAALTQDTTPTGLRFMNNLRRNSQRLWPLSAAAVVGFSDRNRNTYLRRRMGAAAMPMAELTFAPDTQVGAHGKLLSHALRVLQQAQEMHRDRTMTFPRPNAAALMAIKRGEALLSPVLQDIALARASVLSASPSHDAAVLADDSFGFACVKELHDEHLMVSRWMVRPPLYNGLAAPAPQQHHALDGLDLAWPLRGTGTSMTRPH